jgi:1,4-dihydroxy-2-naphthoate octaprenyltransferase
MIFKTILKALKPFQLVCLLTTYVLGGGFVQYVREMKSWSVFFQGGIFLLMLVLSVEFLRLLQDLSDVQAVRDGMSLEEVKKIRSFIAILTATLLTVATSTLIDWMISKVFWQGMLILLLTLVIFGVFYYLSAIIKNLRPYQVLSEVFIFIVIPPAFAYFLQSQDIHRLLSLVLIGLVPAYLAYRLLIFIKRFGKDQKDETPSLVIVMGWEKAMVYHNALILLSYLLFALSAVLGFPWFLLWPVFLTVPIGLVEIWLMERARAGDKPLWRVMQIASLSTFFLPAMLIGFAFWAR